MQISRRAKKYLIWVVAVYLFLDLRPLLLVPNAILFLTTMAETFLFLGIGLGLVLGDLVGEKVK